MVRERHVPSMGGNAHLIAVAERACDAESALTAAVARLAQLEARWSRFRPDSEISELGRAGGRAVVVSSDTRLLVRWCVTAWCRTGGLFDASIAPALEQLGYDRSFCLLEEDPTVGLLPVPKACAAPGSGDIEVDDIAGSVTLPVGVRLDPGGIGKGLAADLVSAEMMVVGASGASVNLAGDIHVRGIGPAGAGIGWTIGVEHPFRPDQPLAVIPLPTSGGAVASSSVLVRRWGGGRHHIVVPSCGRPSDSPVAAVTVVAEEGAWADAATKVALVCPDAAAALSELDRLQTAALLVLHDGTVLTSAGFTLGDG